MLASTISNVRPLQGFEKALNECSTSEGFLLAIVMSINDYTRSREIALGLTNPQWFA